MKLDIQRVESAFDGLTFGEFGPYEKVVGRAHGQVDPHHRLNVDIINLDKAPRNTSNLVEYAVDFCILKPVDMSKSNRRILYDAPNRGDKLALVDLNESVKGLGSNELGSAEDAGNGFLMRQGYVVVFSAWDGAVAPGVGYVEHASGHLLADFPIATNDGAPIVETCREEIICAHTDSPAQAPLAYPAHEPDRGSATLTVRQHEPDARLAVPSGSWRFVSNREIEIDLIEGFDAGAIYELIYAACDPIVMGLGLIGVRDLLGFLRYEDADNEDRSNPLNIDGQPGVDYSIAHGRSQPGRFLREFLRLGFNEDMSGRPVFDGLYTTLTGSRGMFLNQPFSQPGRFPRHHEDHLFPGDQFPFAYSTKTDSLSGKTGGILTRCLANNVCPKVMHVDSSTEFWQGRSSLVVTDELGNEIEQPDEVRTYLLSGSGHAGPQMLAHAPMYWSPSLNPVNELDYCALVRALIVALDEWATQGIEPPPSHYPSVTDGTLVSPEDLNFPDIPGVTYSGAINSLSDRDYSVQPPSPLPNRDYPLLVPTVDSDGNEITGIRSPDIRAPIGTYTGWNYRGPNYAEGALMIVGSFIPFAKTVAERKKSGDPRISLEERYPDNVRYVDAVRKAANELYNERLLIDEDIERYVAIAEKSQIGK